MYLLLLGVSLLITALDWIWNNGDPENGHGGDVAGVRAGNVLSGGVGFRDQFKLQLGWDNGRIMIINP